LYNKERTIRFKKIVYLLEKIRREFTKELHKELTTSYFKINKTKDIVTICYYFPFILRIVEQVVKECNIY
jgi:hypothetical protein